MHAWGIRSIETYRLLLQALDRVKGITPDLAQDFESGDPALSAGAWDEEHWEEPQGTFPWPEEWGWAEEAESDWGSTQSSDPWDQWNPADPWQKAKGQAGSGKVGARFNRVFGG